MTVHEIAGGRRARPVERNDPRRRGRRRRSERDPRSVRTRITRPHRAPRSTRRSSGTDNVVSSSLEPQRRADAVTGRDLPDPVLARAVAVPLRRRILDLILAADHPVTVAELTDELGCNHNAVRQHLAQTARSGPGRGDARGARPARSPPAPVHGHGTTRPLRAPRPSAARRAADRSDATRGGPARRTRRGGRRRTRTMSTRSMRSKPTRPVTDSRPGASDAVDASNSCSTRARSPTSPRTIPPPCAHCIAGSPKDSSRASAAPSVEAFVANDPYRAGCRVEVRRTT